MTRNIRNTPSGQKRGRKKRKDGISQKGEFKDPSGTNCLRKEILYFDVDEEAIVILVDKLELRLLDYLENPPARAMDLAAAVTFSVALFLMFVTTEFHDKFGVSAFTWQVIWGMFLLGSIIWSVVCIISARKAFRDRKPVKEFINELKGHCKAKVKNRDWNYFDPHIEDSDSQHNSDEGVK